MKLSFRNIILLTMAGMCTLCTAVAIFFSNKRLTNDLEQGLVEKSRAILSRVERSAHYVAQMNTLNGVISDTVKQFRYGMVPEEQKMKILRSVPIFAGFQIGREGAEKEHYQFRVASDNARNKDNQATMTELEVIASFRSDVTLKEVVQKSSDGRSISVSVPVRIAESRNCLLCHGAPSTSPWGNEHDILGYKMENMKDGDLKGTFTIISSLDTVQAASKASTQEIILWGIGASLFSLGIAFFLIRIPLDSLGGLAKHVSEVSLEVRQTSESMSASSQQLASSSQEQASSVEETSSSLEEISGLLTSALKSSQQSVDMSHKVSNLVTSSSASMAELQDSMNQIADANTRVEVLAKLIEQIGEKTELIDEIVFQTRLLSFNASVEAERAGEHGRGFAVVAQEVGNLAQMSGKSASEIGQIVKNSIKEAQEVVQFNRSKVMLGVTLCKKTAEQLSDIETVSKEILAGAEHILRASEEQNSGIQQINQSIQLISQATQENASSAEEISSNSISLTSQGDMLVDVVGDLEGLIYGRTRDEYQPQANHSRKPRHAPTSNHAPMVKFSDKVVPFKRPVAKNKPARSVNTGIASKNHEDPWEKI